MPTYEYVCTACGHEFELVQRMSDPPRKRCPQCGKKVERKIGTGAGIIFKGSGFYITDYRSPEYQAKRKAESAAASGGGAESGGAKSSGDGKSGGDGKAPGDGKASDDGGTGGKEKSVGGGKGSGEAAGTPDRSRRSGSGSGTKEAGS